jgi:hypothetical protein
MYVGMHKMDNLTFGTRMGCDRKVIIIAILLKEIDT